MPIDAGSGKAARQFSRQRAKAKPRRRPTPPPRPVVRSVPAPQRRYIGPENRPASAPRRRQALPKTFRTEAAQGGPTKAQKRAINKNATAVRRRVERRQDRAALRLALRSIRQRQEERREERARPFSGDPVRSLRRSTREGVAALSDLQASDPRKYKRNQRSRLDNTIRDVAGAADSALRKTGEVLNERVLTNHSSSAAKRAGLAPDVSKGAREVVDLVSNAPSGVYMAGAAVYEGAKGDRRRARKLVKDFKETSALVPALKGDWKEAANRAAERPVTTVLELQGAKAVVGRGAGAAARSGAFGKRVKQAGSTARPNLKLYDQKREGNGPEVERRYSRDIINKGVQKAYERSVRKGSRVRKDGTQRRPGRDPHTDTGIRLAPANPFDKGPGRAPVRAKLRRRVDTRVFSQHRALERREREAAKKAARDKKDPKRRAILEQQARADKVRLELRQSLKDNPKPAVKKDLRRMLALDDRALLLQVDRIAQGRVGSRTTFTRKYTPDEQAAVVKALDRRARRGKYLTPNQKAAVDAAVGRQIARDVKSRNTPKENPAAATARGILAAAHGKVPPRAAWDGVERRAHERGPRLEPLRAEDFAEYFGNRTRTLGVKPQRTQPNALAQRLGAMQAADADLIPTARARAAREAVAENQRLLADEFGIGPVHETGVKAKAWAKKNRPEGDLVPFKAAEGEWRLVPRVVQEQLAKHAAVDEGLFRPGGSIDRGTSVFKDVVLTSSSPAKWLGGNVGDIGMRTMFAGITPFDIARGIGVDRRLKKHGLQGEQASQALHQGGLYTTGGQGILGQDLMSAGRPISRANVPRQAWRAWKKGIYTLEHAIETLPQYGATGKAMRRDTARSWPSGAKVPVKRATPDQFERAVERTPNAEGYLTPYSKADYAQMQLHLSPDGKSGFALRGNELVNLFAHPGAKIRGSDLLSEAERRGATRLDATAPPGTGLERFYGDRGWRVDREEPWDTKYGPPPVEGARVVYMTKEGNSDAGMKGSLRGLLKLQSQMMDDYAKGIATNRAMEARLQKNVEDVIGRWGKVSPAMRRALSLAPFAQWLGAATRYVYVTLPVHHPIKTSVIAGIMQMTEEERKRLGLSYFAPAEDRAPDYQMGLLPLEVGKNKYGPVVEGIRTSRMSSLGTAGTTPWNLPEFLLPQVAGGLNALAGRSFTGEPLMYPDNTTKAQEGLPMDFIDRLPVALGAQAESMVPFAGAFRRSILEQGRPADPSSTILTPRTRPKFNYETNRYEDREGSIAEGLKEWAMPFAPKSRLYTLGAGRDIERSQQTLRQLEEWNKRRKRKQEARNSYGPPQSKQRQDDFWGSGSAPKKPTVRPKQTQDDFWK